MDVKRAARTALATIRIVNGTVALIAPELFIGRITPSARPNGAAVYAFRMFGIRTILIGRDLLKLSGDELQRALNQAVLIHGADLLTAIALGVKRRVPARKAVLLSAISSVNVALSVAASGRFEPQ